MQKKSTRPVPTMSPIQTARFWSKVRIIRGVGCWVWQGCQDSKGYGYFGLNGQRYHSHRISFAFFRGPLTSELVLDHVCRNPSCVNPQHLELVTERENILRGTGPSAINAAKQTCTQGHEFTDENTGMRDKINRTGRYCRTCSRSRARAYYYRNRSI